MNYQNSNPRYPNFVPEYPNFHEHRMNINDMQYTQPHDFTVTSGGQPPVYTQKYDPGSVNSNPGFPFIPTPNVSDLAMGYGPSVMLQGTEYVKKTMNSYVNALYMKYYFAVNNAYVAKKLALVLFPFAHTKWSVQFDPSGPVPPGDDINAPDLYIPLLAFITYILVSGVILGMQNRFSPEQLGILSTEALLLLVLEVSIFIFCVYMINQQSNLSCLDLIALSGYQFVSMIAILFGYVFLDKTGYYFTLLYTSVASAYFLIRTLKVKVQPATGVYEGEHVRRCAFLLPLSALVQPVIMWWLTRRVVFASARSF